MSLTFQFGIQEAPLVSSETPLPIYHSTDPTQQQYCISSCGFTAGTLTSHICVAHAERKLRATFDRTLQTVLSEDINIHFSMTPV